MRCSQVEKRLAEYTDGLLGAAWQERIEAHLAGCESCRRAVHDTQIALGALRSLPPVRPPETFAPRVRSAIRAQASRALAPPLLGHDLRATLSGVCLMVALGMLVVHYAQPRPYVAPRTVSIVAAASSATVADALPTSAPFRAAVSARPRRTTPPAVRLTRYVPGTGRTMSAIVGRPPGRERLLPKPTVTERAPTAPSGPAVAAPTERASAMPDPTALPRFAEETPEAPRLVVLPTADEPAAMPAVVVPASTATSGAVADVRGPSRPVAASGKTDAVFGFGDLFSEDSLPRYSDVS